MRLLKCSQTTKFPLIISKTLLYTISSKNPVSVSDAAQTPRIYKAKTCTQETVGPPQFQMFSGGSSHKDNVQSFPDHNESARTRFKLDLCNTLEHSGKAQDSHNCLVTILDETTKEIRFDAKANQHETIKQYFERSPPSTCIVIDGEPGVGRTTLARHLCVSSHRKSIFFDALVDAVRQAIKWEDLPEEVQEGVEYSSHSSGDGCHVIIDNGDYIDLTEHTSLLKNIIARKLLPKSKLLIFCRPLSVDAIKVVQPNAMHFSLKGFSMQHAKELIKAKSHCFDKLWVFLETHQLLEVCLNPRICSILVNIFNDQKAGGKEETITSIVYKLVYGIVRASFDSKEKEACRLDNHLECLPETVQPTFNSICLLAKQHIICGRLCKSYVESQQFLSSFGLGLSSVAYQDLFRLGFVVSQTSKSTCAYKFVNPLIAEFLAAFYLHTCSPLNQLEFLFSNSCSLLGGGFRLWLKFFFGLIGADCTSHKSMYNPTKLMLNTVIDVTVDRLKLTCEPKYRYDLIECIHEMQEVSLFRKIALKHPAILSFSIEVDKFEECIVPVLTMINQSQCQEWGISICSLNEAYASKLKDRARNVSITITVKEGDVKIMSIFAKRSTVEVAKIQRDVDRSIKDETKEEMIDIFNRFYCRALREIFQRIFTLYSPVKIKGDATNVSYVSFLTCSCFKESFLANVELFPLQPIHFLPGPKKDFTKLPREHLTATDTHNLEKHNGESMEVVIMLRPTIQKMEGVVPFTNEKFSLLFSKEPIEIFQESSAIIDASELVAICRCMDEYDMNGPHTEQVLSPLPIVQKTIYGRSQTAFPKPFLPPPAEIPQIKPTLQMVDVKKDDTAIHSKAAVTKPHSSSLHLHEALEQSHDQSTHIHVLSGSRTNEQPMVQVTTGDMSVQFFQQQTVGETRVHAATSQRQTAVTPGTVLFTCIPEIPSDQIQPLPRQRSLIRKGGNGVIFSETVGGIVLAVKKTSYRSKEFAIITKIRHKNIIPLLAYVWGEEHSENKRRYYVYHYLPKLSGDLARLVTDKEELSLYEYHKMHQYSDLKAMGVALGNVKYILSQVLLGLQYLHSTHIAHRDLKASNVLIKFFCGCVTPLECNCEVKYQVVLCDFDAAIQLDCDDHIPAKPLASLHHNTGASPQFEIVPVGTNGFRSPESSMHVISNDPKAFSPPFTTKCDIYSFGVLALRLMISTDTPYSQRSMAMLLLHYHQMKENCCEGRVSDRLSPHIHCLAGSMCLKCLRIENDTALKILKLNELELKMSWLRGSYEFVKKCLSVDPDTRSPAKDLLADPFLN